MPLPLRDAESVAIVRVNVETAAGELAKDLEVAACGDDGRERVIAGGGVGAMIGEEPHDGEVTVLGGEADGVVVVGVRAGATLEEQPHDVRVSAQRCQAERHVVLAVHVRAVREQHAHGFQLSLLRPDAERFRVVAVRIGALIEKQAECVEIAVRGGPDQPQGESGVVHHTNRMANRRIRFGGPARESAPIAAPEVELTKELIGPWFWGAP